jgi:hypothetical protein
VEFGWVNFHIWPTTRPTYCELNLPDRTVCYYAYDSGTTSPPNEICRISSNVYNYCEFEVDISSKRLSGIYTLKYNMIGNDRGEETFHVYLHTGKNIQIPHISIILSSLKALRFLVAWLVSLNDVQQQITNFCVSILADSSIPFPGRKNSMNIVHKINTPAFEFTYCFSIIVRSIHKWS